MHPLQLGRGFNGVIVFGKHDEHAITKEFHGVPAMGVADLANPLGQVRDGLGCLGVAQ